MSNKRENSNSDNNVKRSKLKTDFYNDIKHCDVCDLDIDRPMFQNHLKSNTHKNNLQNSNSDNNVQTDFSNDIKHCDVCDLDIDRPMFQNHRKSNTHKNNLFKNVDLISTAFKSRIRTYRIKDSNPHNDYTDFMKKQEFLILELITEVLQVHHALKINFQMFGNYVKYESDGINDTKSFNTKNEIVNESTDLNKMYQKFIDNITTKSEEFQEKDSGWALEKVLHLEVNINKYNPMQGSSYVDLPDQIQ